MRYVERQSIAKPKSYTKTSDIIHIRFFVARYERVIQKNLPSNATIRRNEMIGPRQQQKLKAQARSGPLGSVFSRAIIYEHREH